MNRPTPEQIKEARAWLREKERSEFADDAGPSTWARVRVLLAATEPETDEDLYASAERQWNDGAAENESDFVEGYFAGVRSITGTPEAP